VHSKLLAIVSAGVGTADRADLLAFSFWFQLRLHYRKGIS
jgi:hypothetical protein